MTPPWIYGEHYDHEMAFATAVHLYRRLHPLTNLNDPEELLKAMNAILLAGVGNEPRRLRYGKTLAVLSKTGELTKVAVERFKAGYRAHRRT